MTDRRGTKIYRGTKSEVEADTSTSLYGAVFVSTDRYTLTFVDDNGDHQPIVPSINDVATAGAVDSAADYLLMYDASAGVETKVLIDDAVSAAVSGTDLSLTDKTATTYTVASSTGTNAQLTAATTSLAGLLTASDKTKLDGIETSATADQTGAEIKALYEAEADTNAFTDADHSKLDGIEAGAEVNNISNSQATDLTDLGDSLLHYHSTDRDRANHTGTQTASTISDFDTEVSNNTSVTANTAKVSADGSIATHSDVSISGAESEQYLIYNGSNWVNKYRDWIDYYLGTGGVTGIAGTATKLTLNNTNTFSSSGHFVRVASVITCQETGKLKVEFFCGLSVSGGNLSDFEIYIDNDGVEVPGSRSPGNSGAINKVVSVTAGDKLTFYAIRNTGTGTASQINNSTRVFLQYI